MSEEQFCDDCGHELTVVTHDPYGAPIFECEPCVYSKATIYQLKHYQTMTDARIAAHHSAVRTILELLEVLGYEDVVAEFRKVPRP